MTAMVNLFRALLVLACLVSGCASPSVEYYSVHGASDVELAAAAEAARWWNDACGRVIIVPTTDDVGMSVHFDKLDTQGRRGRKTGDRVEVYEDPASPDLVEIIAHEMGHALGLRHSEPGVLAIMTPLDTVGGVKAADVEALRQIGYPCGLPRLPQEDGRRDTGEGSR